MALMKLILRADVDNLGRLGDIVTVRPGFGRNYLVPQGLARPATQANLKQFELERRKLEAKADALRATAREVAEKLAATKVEITVRVGEGDKLYGSVTTTNIAEALAELGVDIDRRKMILEDPIRSLGDYDIPVRLHPDVTGEIKLSVLRFGQPMEEEAADEAVEETVEESAEEVVAEDGEQEQPAQ